MAVWPSGSANATLLYNAGMLIRTERGTDRAAVHAVNAAAFPTPAEADLVDALRRQASDVETVYTAYVVDAAQQLVQDEFHCVPRGKVDVKGKIAMEMYFVSRITR